MTAAARKLRFAYMDHWRVDGPQGYVSQYSSVKLLDSFVGQSRGARLRASRPSNSMCPC
ncbi:MAG: hypothetical protein U1F30_12350 [Steroidobacteraceae bacterium]